MKKLFGILGCVTVGAVIVLGMSGCTEPDNPLTAVDRDPDVLSTQSFRFPELRDNDLSDAESREIITIFASEEASMDAPQQPMPVLYLLHDLGGDAYSFARYNLQAMISDMFDRGEIGRMLIVTVDASNAFGGSYYRNAAAYGYYEDMITTLIAKVERERRVYLKGGRAARAISGHGMGGYGAFRYALERPEMFNAVSAMSAPLSFGEPTDDFGIWGDLVPEVFFENGVTVPDPSATVYDKLAAGRLNPASSIFMAMSAAFSPHPLRRFDSLGSLIVCRPLTNCVRKDTFMDWPFYSALPVGPRTIKFTDIGDTLGVGVDMIFDSTGVRDDDVWARWLDADVKTTFARKREAQADFFDDVAIYFDVGEDDELGYVAQNNDFDNYLRTEAGITDHTYIVYPGYGGTPAGHADLVLTRLREVIKFHDKLFDNGGRPPKPGN